MEFWNRLKRKWNERRCRHLFKFESREGYTMWYKCPICGKHFKSVIPYLGK